MKKSRKLSVIQSERHPQERLSLLVTHGFKDEASTMVRELVHNHTAMFHNDWHDKDFCRPLERVTKNSSPVYVICCSRNQFDYHPYPHLKKEPEWHIIFELGWEQKVLGWSKKESEELVRQICAQALIRPLNQWEFKQAEGTGRAAREMLPVDDPMAREIAALHLVYHFRQADFGHIWQYLCRIPGSPEMRDDWMGGSDYQAIINWIAKKLFQLGWSQDRIRKEFVEWISLKTGTWPAWLLAVAKAEGVFTENDYQLRATALRRWINQGFDFWFKGRSDKQQDEQDVKLCQELFHLAHLTAHDAKWMTDKLVVKMASGKVSEVKWFVKHFSTTDVAHPLDFSLDLAQIRLRAKQLAEKAGNYGIVVGLMTDGKEDIDTELKEQVELLGQSTKLE
jgi:hypothetical protein